MNRTLMTALVAASIAATIAPRGAIAKPNECTGGSGMMKVPVDGGHVTHDFICLGGQWAYSDSYFIADGSSQRSGGRDAGPDGSGGVHIIGRGALFGDRGGGGRDASGGGGGGSSAPIPRPTETDLATPARRYSADGIDPRGRSRMRAAIDGDRERTRSRVGGEPSDHLASDGKNPPHLEERGLRSTLDAFDRDACAKAGSLIECQAQVLDEAVPLLGTSVALHYRSTNVIGYRAANELRIPVLGATVPPGLKRVHVQASIEGQSFSMTYPARANQIAKLTWDGKDAQRSAVTDGTNAFVQVGYEYPADYRPQPDAIARELENHILVPPGTLEGGAVYVKWSTWVGPIGAWDARAHGLGGWTVSSWHHLNTKTHQLRYGDGALRSLYAAPCTRRGATDCEEYRVLSPDGAELHVFDGQGFHLETIATGVGRSIRQFVYQGTGAARRLREIRDLDGKVTTFELDAAGRIGLVRGPYGDETRLGYDANGWLEVVQHPHNAWTQLRYRGTSGLLEKKINPEASARLFVSPAHTYSFDCSGRLESDTDPDGKQQTLARWQSSSALEYTVTHTLSPHYATVYRVSQDPYSDAPSEVLTTTAPTGLVTTVTRTLDGRRATTVLPSGATLDRRHGPHPQWGDDVDFLISERVTLPSGKSLATTSELAVVLADPADPLSVTLRRSAVHVDNGLGQRRTLETRFDRATGRFVLRQPSGRTESATLDALGQLVAVDRPGSVPTTFGYRDGRLESITQGSRVTTLGYDGRGRLAAIDANGRVTRFTGYDGARHLTAWQDALGIGHQAQNNRDGDVVRVFPPGRTAHLLAPTDGGRPGRYLPPDLGGTPDELRLGWSSSGLLGSISRGDGVVSTRNADGAGRATSTIHTIPAGLDVRTTGTPLAFFDPKSGAIAELRADGGEVLRFGNVDGLPAHAEWSGVVEGAVDLDYDDWLQPSRLTIAGRAVDLTYDDDGLLSSLGALTITRDPSTGRMSAVTVDKTLLEPTYDATFGNARRLRWTVDGTALFDVTREEDGFGLTASRREVVGGAVTTFAYEHDALGRLTKVTRERAGTTRVSNYRYDDNGNRVYVERDGVALDAAKGEIDVDGRDQLRRYGDEKLSYTPNGQVATRTNVKSGAVTTYVYSVMGPLAEVRLPDGRTIEYVLDGALQRVGKRIDGALVQGFLYDGHGRPVAEVAADGKTVVSRFYYATQAQLPDYLERGGKRYAILRDHLGSPRLVVDASDGTVAQELEFDEWGNVERDTNPGFQPFGFAGGLLDRDTGLVQFGARDYDPRLGRWLARDPLLFAGGTENLFEYAFDNPIDFVDLDGMQPAPPAGPPPGPPEAVRWEPKGAAIARVAGTHTPYGRVAAQVADDIEHALKSGSNIVDDVHGGIPELQGIRNNGWWAHAKDRVGSPAQLLQSILETLRGRGHTVGTITDPPHRGRVPAQHQHITIQHEGRWIKVSRIHLLSRALSWAAFFYTLGKTNSVWAATERSLSDFFGENDMNGGDALFYRMHRAENDVCADFSDRVCEDGCR